CARCRSSTSRHRSVDQHGSLSLTSPSLSLSTSAHEHATSSTVRSPTTILAMDTANSIHQQRLLSGTDNAPLGQACIT
ncbi:hypothetical protein TELCIR_25578, partial [Teladorsagia circumcincta]